MIRTRSPSLALLLPLLTATALAISGNALPANPGGKGISMMTVHMQRMSQLETALQAALNAQDNPSVDKLLSPFFEVRRAGMIVTRDVWIQEGVKSDGELHQLSAYEVGNSVVANFMLVASGQPTRFIVDVWTLENDEWRLRVRFETVQTQKQTKPPRPPMPNNK
jgi:hypothetical protein